MTPEEILKPRYKVIADYPAASFDVGVILMRHHKIEDWLYCPSIENDFYGLKESCAKKYPHLFRKLEWWEDRKHSELPSYVKKTDTGILFKVQGWRTSPNTAQITGAYIANDGNDFEEALLFAQDILPVTEDEYNEYYQITIKDKQ